MPGRAASQPRGQRASATPADARDGTEEEALLEAVMIWNEPNNRSHWDFGLDAEWESFGRMARAAGDAVRAERPGLRRVLGGISPIDPHFVARMDRMGVLDEMDVVAVHGFPLDWNLWCVEEWPDHLAAVQAVTDLPVWVTEVGVSSYAGDAVQLDGMRRTLQALHGRAERIHWYSLFDLPRDWGATTRHKQREGSSYFRHFHMGLIREDGTTKPALSLLAQLEGDLGVCQWFHFQDPRLEDAVRWLKRLGVKKLRTGLSWSDDHRDGSMAWFDRQMKALEPFDVTLTFCFTPEHEGLVPHYTSPPKDDQAFADFCGRMVRRYG